MIHACASPADLHVSSDTCAVRSIGVEGVVVDQAHVPIARSRAFRNYVSSPKCRLCSAYENPMPLLLYAKYVKSQCRRAKSNLMSPMPLAVPEARSAS